MPPAIASTALPDWRAATSSGVDSAIWGLYAPTKVVSSKVRAFMTFLEHLHAPAYQWTLA
jgi:hypothetical protein